MTCKIIIQLTYALYLVTHLTYEQFNLHFNFVALYYTLQSNIGNMPKYICFVNLYSGLNQKL